MSLSKFFFCIIFIFSNALFADELIIEPNEGRAPILRALTESQREIDLVMYGLTDETFISVLTKTKNKKITTKILLEKSPYRASSENEIAFKKLTAANLLVKNTIPNIALIHEKMLLIDDDTAYIMTFNWTQSTFRKERNFALKITQKNMIHEIKQMFLADFEKRHYDPREENLIWSPDNSREKILKLINSAQKTIHIYAQQVSDYAIVGALGKAANRGVKIKILSAQKLREKQEIFLEKKNVSIRYAKHFYIHAKTMVIDNEKAMIGSINLTKHSLDTNRELSIISHDPSVILPLQKQFNYDWQKTLGAREKKFSYSRFLKNIKKHFQFLMHS